jgi:hypothetical protein
VRTAYIIILLPIIFTTILWVGYDLVAKFYLGEENYPTVSMAIFRVSQEYPIIPALIGLVVGILFAHFFDNTNITNGY